MSAEELAAQAADRVREVIADAERRAKEIVDRAEGEAAEIRSRAEAEAREKLERARRTLSELVGEAPEAGAAPERPSQPVSDSAPEPAAEPTAAPNGDGDTAARLVAMKLALDGAGRDEIAGELDAKFGASDRSALLDEVLARAGR